MCVHCAVISVLPLFLVLSLSLLCVRVISVLSLFSLTPSLSLLRQSNRHKHRHKPQTIIHRHNQTCIRTHTHNQIQTQTHRETQTDTPFALMDPIGPLGLDWTLGELHHLNAPPLYHATRANTHTHTHTHTNHELINNKHTHTHTHTHTQCSTSVPCYASTLKSIARGCVSAREDVGCVSVRVGVCLLYVWGLVCSSGWEEGLGFRL